MSTAEQEITNANYERDPPNNLITNANYKRDPPNIANITNGNVSGSSNAGTNSGGKTNDSTNTSYNHTGSGYWGGSYYPYWSLMLITVLFGFFGGDHYFLRSPRSGLMKFFVNIFTFGAWWIYDIIQIFRDKQTVLKSGLSIPALGPAGIAAGIFTDMPGNPKNKEPIKSPWLYLLFLFFAVMPYTLGIDSFVAGDIFGGVFKLTGILFLPMLFILPQKVLEVYRIFITPDIFFEKGLPRFPGVNYLIGDWGCHSLAPENYEGLCAGGLLGFALGLLPATTKAIDIIVASPFETVAAAAKVVEGTVELGQELIEAAGGTVKIVAAAGNAVRNVATLAEQAGQAEKAAIEVANKTLAEAKPMKGGAQETDSMSVGALILVTGLIICGGLYQGGLRIKQLLKQNERAPRDDSPP